MPKQVIDIKADIRDRLLHVAIHLFAEKGIDAVSLRAIGAEAGSKNKSAVHYHFGSKEGILEAIFKMIDDKTSLTFNEMLHRLEKKAEKENLSISEILLSYYLPLYTLYIEENIGADIVKLLSIMMIDSRKEYKTLFNTYFEKHIERVFHLLKKQLPGKNEQELKFQLIHSFMATITGIATIDLMDNTPLGDIRFNNDIDMMVSYLNYVSGGLSNSKISINEISSGFWQDFEKVFPQISLGEHQD